MEETRPVIAEMQRKGEGTLHCSLSSASVHQSAVHDAMHG